MNSIKNLTLTGVIKSKIDRCIPEVETLWSMGSQIDSLTHQPWVAIVGTRKPTPYGLALVRDVTEQLVRAGVVIVSGLAYGIDVTAHRIALESGGFTIAVLPSDLEKIYPSAHKKTAELITQNGCLISEYRYNPRPMAHHFLSRNRIIAGLSDLIWIPEASERSGSLNTAKHAKSMSITVCASPGRATDTMSAGTNKLLRSHDAHLVTSAQDIYNLLSVKPAELTTYDSSQLTDSHTSVLHSIKAGICDTTLLSHALGVAPSNLMSTLTELEIQGYIAQDNIGRWMLRR